jgi:uncharacterized protein (DUF488 family)
MDETPAAGAQRIFTIGHSNHDEPAFVHLLQQYEVEVVADVRSQPYSKHHPQFNTDQLKSMLAAAGIQYLFLGQQLGGRPADPECYDEQGRVLYDRAAASPSFRLGVERLEKGVQKHRIAVMCGEENPLDCHRNLLVGRVLSGRGLDVRHIRGDGRLQTSAEVECESRPGDSRQQLLFPELKERPWRSTRSVTPRPQRPDSSES